MTPRVSIIIPVYNVEKYIVECLQSVANQTVADKIECIVVDDCGHDNSFAVAKEWINGYRLKNREVSVDFKLIQREKNGGLSAARNTGIEASEGEYLFFLDSDDTIMPNCIELMRTLAKKYGGVDIVQGCYDSKSKILTDFIYTMPEFSKDRRFIKRMILDYDRFPVMAQNRLVKRSFITKNNLYFKEGIIHEDNYWSFFISKYIQSFAICPIPTYYYRPNPNGIMAQKDRNQETKAFTTFIRDFSANIDSLAEGAQKRLILYNLITLLDNQYYADEEERKELIEIFANKNSYIERLLLRFYIITSNNKILHLLERMYKY